MDYAKLDAGLAAALNDVADKETSALSVFIHAGRPVEPDEARFLETLGVQNGTPEQQVFTATVSPEAVEKLSDQAWVKSLRLSRVLKPLDF